jgi:magnesium transporter
MNADPGSNAPSRWQWYKLSGHQPMDNSIQHAYVHKWIDESLDCKQNFISVTSFEGENNTIHGTVVIHPNPHTPENKHLLRYFVTRNELVTIGLAEFLYKANRERSFHKKVQECNSPIEALLFIVNHMIELYFEWMDHFELQLAEAKSNMRMTNGGHLFRFIIELRYNLLHWNAQMIPLKEIRFAAEEVFHDQVQDSDKFAALILRLKRVQMLQDEYKAEIDSLLKLDEATITYRGNDIMKTLTVFTVLLTPLTALGAIWGMNFKFMPEIEWKWGYFASLIFMVSLVGSIYLYLKKQGWTGNILEIDDTLKKAKRGSS